MSNTDKSRHTIREKFTLSMLLAVEEWNMNAPEDRKYKKDAFVTANKIAVELEAAMYIHFNGVNNSYKEKFRMLCFNLNDSKNPELRSSILQGEITCKKIIDK